MKQLFNSIKIIGIAAVLAVGVSYVSAWNPGSTVPTVITTGTADQTKDGALMSEKFQASDLAFFKKTLLPGNDSWLNIGGEFAGTTPDSISGIQSAGGTTPLVIHLNNRATSVRDSVQGQDAVRFISGDAQCHGKTAIINDRASAFELVSLQNGGHADIIARQLKLSGGSPQDGSVLAAVDTNGNAVWARLVVENGAVAVKDVDGRIISAGTTTSPVTADQCN